MTYYRGQVRCNEEHRLMFLDAHQNVLMKAVLHKALSSPFLEQDLPPLTQLNVYDIIMLVILSGVELYFSFKFLFRKSILPQTRTLSFKQKSVILLGITVSSITDYFVYIDIL